MRTLIILAYYDRPNFLRICLRSIREQTTDNWELAIIDDGSKIHAKPIVEEEMFGLSNKITYYRSEYVPEDKEKYGSEHTKLMDKAMDSMPDDTVIVVICEDDAMYPDYIEKLQKFYTDNPVVKSCWSYHRDWFPFEERFDDVMNEKEVPKIKFQTNHVCMSNQSTWKNHPNIRFNCNKVKGADRVIFDKLKQVYKTDSLGGPCTGILGTLKGIYNENMTLRKNLKATIYNPVDLPKSML